MVQRLIDMGARRTDTGREASGEKVLRVGLADREAKFWVPVAGEQ